MVVAMDTQIESILDCVEQALGRADLECACEALGPLVIPGPCPGPAEPLLARVWSTCNMMGTQALSSKQLYIRWRGTRL